MQIEHDIILPQPLSPLLRPYFAFQIKFKTLSVSFMIKPIDSRLKFFPNATFMGTPQNLSLIFWSFTVAVISPIAIPLITPQTLPCFLCQVYNYSHFKDQHSVFLPPTIFPGCSWSYLDSFLLWHLSAQIITILPLDMLISLPNPQQQFLDWTKQSLKLINKWSWVWYLSAMKKLMDFGIRSKLWTEINQVLGWFQNELKLKPCEMISPGLAAARALRQISWHFCSQGQPRLSPERWSDHSFWKTWIIEIGGAIISFILNLILFFNCRGVLAWVPSLIHGPKLQQVTKWAHAHSTPRQ